jgi:hypothetical protein
VDRAHAPKAALPRFDDEIGQRIVRLVDRVPVKVDLALVRPSVRGAASSGCRRGAPVAENVCSASCSWPMSQAVGAGSAPYFDAVNASASSAMRCLAIGAGRGE